MNKELTPLQALNRLCTHLDYDETDYCHNGSSEEDIEIIETALKALEIINKKKVDVQLLKDSKNLNDYNWCVHTKDRALTQEEYDFLKGIFNE